MIYFVTENSPLFDPKEYKIISVKESLELLSTLKIVGVDTETSGIDVHTKKLLLVQLGCPDFQVVIDCDTIDIHLYKDFLETKERLFLFWNAKFDLKFFLKEGIIIQNIYDGFLAERIIWLGYPPGSHSMSLKSAGELYCNIELDKSVRGKIIWAKTLSTDIIVYAANDVKYLEPIRESQLKLLKEKDLITALAYENKFCQVLAYTEYCGVKLDEAKWKKKMQEDQKELQDSVNGLNNWVIDHFPDSKYVYINYQGDLWAGFDLTPKCLINWSSPKQVAPLFEEIGFNLEVFDKETKKMKKSVSSDVIAAQESVSDIAPIYVKYKKMEKLVGTYGQNVLDLINPVTGRIHTNFNQLCNTGRLSSGGKDKERGIENINFQNFPADERTRSCFISEPGYSWISCDYKSQESRIIGELSGDPAILDLYNHGCGDMHSLVAKMSYPDIIKDCPIEDVKAKFKELRQDAKGIEFAINYGGDANTIQSNKGIPKAEAQKVYDDYMKGFPGVKQYQDYQRKFVMTHGYILLNNKTRHKNFIPEYPKLKEIQNKFCKEYWAEYERCKKIDRSNPIVQEVKYYFKTKSECEKHSINYPCQGTGAVMFKLASIFLYDYLIEHNLLFKVRLCIPAHDEWNIEVPEEMTDQMSKVLIDCMMKSGAYFCKKIDFPADAEIGKCWIH